MESLANTDLPLSLELSAVLNTDWVILSKSPTLSFENIHIIISRATTVKALSTLKYSEENLGKP